MKIKVKENGIGGNGLLVKPMDSEGKTKGGIIIPDSVKNAKKLPIFEVVMKGPFVKEDNGVSVDVGDFVYINMVRSVELKAWTPAGIPVKFDNETGWPTNVPTGDTTEYWLIQSRDILFVLDGNG